ncbi:MAG: hypothetical protein CME06_06135 [Gemmatimonadetes bacterium]|nr:hypothetical protein [Gemmatimonadota bacterium]
MGGGDAPAGVIVQPVPEINLLENPGFETKINPNNLSSMFGCGTALPPGEHVVQWWGVEIENSDFNYYGVMEPGADPQRQIEFATEAGGNTVAHFKWGAPVDEYFLTYRRSPTSCTYLQNQSISIDQWEKEDIHIRFRAKGTPGEQLTVTALLSNVRFLDFAQDDLDEVVDPRTDVALAAAWTDHEIVIDKATLPWAIRSMSIRFALENPSAQAALDDVEIVDELLWITQSGEANDVEIHPDGQLRVNGEPYALSTLDDKAQPSSLQGLKDRYQKIGFGEEGLEFNTVIFNPEHANSYPTKRHALLALDAAQSAGMKVILWLPNYPATDPGTPLPLVPGLTEEWVNAFNDHPAFLGWSYGDELAPSQVELANDPIHWDDKSLLRLYEEIDALDTAFQPIFAYTSGIMFEDFNHPVGGAPQWANSDLCKDDRPYGCLRAMLEMTHIVMPNYHPIRASGSEPEDVIGMLSQWCWSAAYHHYVEKIISPEGVSPTDARAVLPVVQFRPYHCSAARPAWGYQVRAMAAQAVASHGIGYIAHDNAALVDGFPDGDCDDHVPPAQTWIWDILDEENRALWQAYYNGTDHATDILDQFPDVNRTAENIAERRFDGLPAFNTLPPKIVLHGAPKTTHGGPTWTVQDGWMSKGGELGQDMLVRSSDVCGGIELGDCTGFGVVDFDDLSGVIDP